jgi:hypothetical protein
VWNLAQANEATGGEPGNYLVDDAGVAKYRVVTGISLDLSKQLGFPRDWLDRPLPAVAAFSILILVLLWTGLRARPAVVE